MFAGICRQLLIQMRLRVANVWPPFLSHFEELRWTLIHIVVTGWKEWLEMLCSRMKKFIFLLLPRSVKRHLIPGASSMACHHVQSDGQWVVIPQKNLNLTQFSNCLCLNWLMGKRWGCHCFSLYEENHCVTPTLQMSGSSSFPRPVVSSGQVGLICVVFGGDNSVYVICLE